MRNVAEVVNWENTLEGCVWRMSEARKSKVGVSERRRRVPTTMDTVYVEMRLAGKIVLHFLFLLFVYSYFILAPLPSTGITSALN